MKSPKAILIFLFLTFPYLSFTQSFGFKAGPLFNNVEVKIIDGKEIFEVKKPESYLAYQGGVMYKEEMNNFFALKTELSYMVRGATNFYGFDEDIKLYYVDFSVLAMFQIIKNGTIDIGVAPTLLTRNRIIFNRFDFGLIAGSSYLIKNKVELSVRYFYGLIPLMSSNLTDASGNDAGLAKYYNRNLMISVGYYFL